MQLIIRILCLSVVSPLWGCTHTAAVPDVDADAAAFPPIAAEFRTTVEVNDEDRHQHVTKATWRMWRNVNRIVTENAAAGTAEIWQRDGASVFHQKIFHQDRKSVEYQPDDLRLSGMAVSWPRQSLLVDPEVLKRLTLKSASWHEGHPYRRYVGEVEDARWDITIRTDDYLVVRVSRVTQRVRERTEMVSSHPLSSAPWQPTPHDDYDVIDFTDFGDRQSDPFVTKVQVQLGQPHTH